MHPGQDVVSLAHDGRQVQLGIDRLGRVDVGGELQHIQAGDQVGPAAPGADLVAQPYLPLGCAVNGKQLQVGYFREILPARRGDKGHCLRRQRLLRLGASLLKGTW